VVSLVSCIVEDCVMRANGFNAHAYYFPQLRCHEFRNCVIGGSPIQNYTITPHLIETDQVDQFTFTVDGGPNDEQPRDWARPENRRPFFSQKRSQESEVFLKHLAGAVLLKQTMGAEVTDDQLMSKLIETSDADFILQQGLSLARGIELMSQYKAEGTELMQEGFLLQASRIYDHSFWIYVAVIKAAKGFNHNPRECDALVTALCNNKALCSLKRKQWQAAINACGGVFHFEPDNIKALYRRAQANIELGNHDEAEADLQRATKLAPDEQGVTRLLAACSKDKRKQKAKEKKAFGAMFS